MIRVYQGVACIREQHKGVVSECRIGALLILTSSPLIFMLKEITCAESLENADHQKSKRKKFVVKVSLFIELVLSPYSFSLAQTLQMYVQENCARIGMSQP